MSFPLAELTPTQLMTLPFLECLVLVGIHSYLGLHVIRRQVIFVDLSLAQIAALGTTVGFLLGIHPHGTGAFLFSLSFTFLGAAVFALTRTRREHVPQEAIIGIVYAIAAAVTILIIAYAPHGAEHITEVLTGNILNVRSDEVLHAAVAYAFVGVFHYVFRDRFMAITQNAQTARERGINVTLWDLLFYMSFGFVITFSVNVAGVLLVFVFLVVPAVIATAITDRFWLQLLIGWGLGFVVSVLGLTISYVLDKPSGPTVIALYGVVLLLVALVLYVVRSKFPVRALAHIGIGALALVLVVGYFVGLRRIIYAVPGWRLGEYSSRHVHAPTHHKKTEVAAFDDTDVEAKAKAVKKMKDLAKIRRFFRKATTAEGRVKLAERAAQIEPGVGARMLLKVLDSDAPVFWRNEALEHLGKLCKTRFALDLMSASAPQARALIERVRGCVKALPGAPKLPSSSGGPPATRPKPRAHDPMTPAASPPR